MYAAIWIDGEQATASKRIVVCKPLLERQGAAMAVLRSHKREGSPSVILSGDGDRLRHLLAMIDKLDDRWDHLSDEDLITAVIKTAEQCEVSPIEFGEEAAEALAHLVLAISRIPKPKSYPRFITPKAKKLWDEIVVEHKDVIDRFKSDKEKMWAAAIIMLQRYAGEQGIEPFTKDPAADEVRKMAVNDINQKANKGNFKALQIVQDLFDELKGEGLASALTKEQFYEATKHRELFYVTTFQRIKLSKVAMPSGVIGRLLSKSGFYGKPGQYAAQAMNAVTDLIIEPEGKDIHAYITTHLSRDQIIILFRLDEKVTVDQILKHLSAAGRKWVKTGILTEVA